MSEYIEIDTEQTDDPDVLLMFTNLPLATEQTEIYTSQAALEVGSPVAQALAVIDGILRLEIDEDQITVTRDPMYDWYAIVDDISAALKDFFL